MQAWIDRIDAARLPIRLASYAGIVTLGLAFAALLVQPVLPWAKALPGDWLYAIFSSVLVCVLLFLCFVAASLVVRGLWEAAAVLRPQQRRPEQD